MIGPDIWSVVPVPERLLILGGTAEAVALAVAADEAGFRVTSSLAGRTSGGTALPGRVRVGGFGGLEGFLAYLRAESFAAVIDATHPFAATISAHARLACDLLALPRLSMRRPPWTAQSGDRWYPVASLAEAAARLPELGRRAFLTVGTRGLELFAPCADLWCLVRLITPPPLLPFPGQILTDRGPFTLDGELALLREHRIDILVTKASGGTATEAKLTAARILELPVLMVERPPPEPGPLALSVAEAMVWLTEVVRCPNTAEGLDEQR